MQAWLNSRWYDPQRGSCVALRPLAWLYGVGLAVRRARAPQPTSLGAPVIVVGNLTVGGTGKTPLAVWVANALVRQGLCVGLISRGYGRHAAGVRLLGADSDWREVGDEPLILARRTGCLTAVGRERVQAARAVLAHGARVIVSDDGLQHLALPRACSIAVADGARGFGNGQLLPAGPLRESLERLAGLDALVINGAAEHPSLQAAGEYFPPLVLRMDLLAGQAVALGSAERRTLESFRGTAVHAVAGIGHPQRFFRDLRARGLEVREHAFPDHHPLTAAELDFGDDLPVLMTEKDAVKCPGGSDRRLWFVPVEAAFSAADAARLSDLLMRTVDSFARPSGG
jgi:tetraacyldisaccharide 4'-kinase